MSEPETQDRKLDPILFSEGALRLGFPQVGRAVQVALALPERPKEIDSELLAAAIRAVAIEMRKADADDETRSRSVFLFTLSKALLGRASDYQLRLTRTKTGRPRNADPVLERAQLVGELVGERLLQGWKKEAALQEAMSRFELSRTSANRAYEQFKRLRVVLERNSARGWVHDGKPFLTTDDLKEILELL